VPRTTPALLPFGCTHEQLHVSQARLLTALHVGHADKFVFDYQSSKTIWWFFAHLLS
jgi:hypothetical protein